MCTCVGAVDIGISLLCIVLSNSLCLSVTVIILSVMSLYFSPTSLNATLSHGTKSVKRLFLGSTICDCLISLDVDYFILTGE